jgi:pimeloyl-ACP methyl ester carboxylesterase
VNEAPSAVPRVPDTLRAAYPWTGHTLDLPGGRMHYLDEGPRDAPVMVAVHGNPTWSFYWRRLVARYAGAYRVIVPDHLGCGLSDKPQQWSYRLADHIHNLQSLLDHLGVRDITLVVHDWGGAIGMGAAVANPERFRRFVVTNTGAWRSLQIPPSIATVKIPVFGALAVRGFNGFAQVATWRATAKGLSPVAREGLLFPYDSWHNRIATLRFVQDIPLHPAHPSYAALARIDDGLATLTGHPMLLLWGDDDFCFTPKFRAEWERRFPEAEVHHWADVGHYVMEDVPERVIERVDAFLERTR